MVTSAKADAITSTKITKALYSDATQKQLRAGHAKGKLITRENAVKGVASRSIRAPRSSTRKPGC